MSPQRCATCGEPIPPRPTPGRPRRYCSGRCRTEAYRLRQADAFDTDLPGSQPRPEPYLRAEMIQVADMILTEETKASPEDQLARAIIEARSLEASLQRLAALLPPALSWRAATLANAISTTLKKVIGGIE